GRWRAMIQAGYQCLQAEPPNTVTAREIVDRVETAVKSRVDNMRRDSLWQRWGTIILAAFLVLSLALAGVVPGKMAIVSIPAWALFLGAAGGSASGLVALRSRIDSTRPGKLTVFAAGTRPFLGAVIGSLVYLLFASGAIAITVGTNPRLFYTLVAL